MDSIGRHGKRAIGQSVTVSFEAVTHSISYSVCGLEVQVDTSYLGM
jgi:hypothetical protein